MLQRDLLCRQHPRGNIEDEHAEDTQDVAGSEHGASWWTYDDAVMMSPPAICTYHTAKGHGSASARLTQ